MIRVLLIGKNGQIGWELFQSLQHVVTVVAPERFELDVTNHHDVTRLLEGVKPDIVINATGYNDVDGAEVNKNQAVSVNVNANLFLATASKRVNAFYLTYSSDYVFDGQKKTPYVEDDLVNPLNMYGQTKLDGEMAIKNSNAGYIILRTSSVFSTRRPCFLRSFLKKTQESSQIHVRSDLISSPTSANYLAEITTKIILTGKDSALKWLSDRQGIYHLAGTGAASRFEWAQKICNILRLNVEILPSTSWDNTSSPGANRPVYSALDSSRFYNIFGFNSVSWETMLEKTLDGLK